VTPVSYAEIVASVASRSAGPGTRANIDEFTRTTSRGLELVGGAARGKAIVVLNPADPPLIMRDTIFCAVDAAADTAAVAKSVVEMAEEVARYVPGYRLLNEPQFDPVPGGAALRVAIFVEIAGAGDFLPPYAGNLDIMTAAATRVALSLTEA
jgi:acetaldehyde dehydrogenase